MPSRSIAKRLSNLDLAQHNGGRQVFYPPASALYIPIPSLALSPVTGQL